MELQHLPCHAADGELRVYAEQPILCVCQRRLPLRAGQMELQRAGDVPAESTGAGIDMHG
jgi:hypothetical protein